jgi:predicted amidophosphoribosyltransferase
VSRPNRCDVCTHPRRRWQRLCEVCWNNLPGDIRTAITESHRQGKRLDHRAAVKRAADHLAERVARHMRHHQARTAAMLGERDG